MPKSATATPLATALKQLRAAAGISYQMLSDRAHVDVKYLYELENGIKLHPSRDVLYCIGHGLGLELDAINDLALVAGQEPLAPFRPKNKNGPETSRPASAATPDQAAIPAA